MQKQLAEPSSLLNCPVCKTPLLVSISGACCVNNHQFDRARQGYLNLLLGHKKRSRNPGDDKAMVEARSQFLNTGYYGSIAKALTDDVSKMTLSIKRPVIVDAGCGEGYYTYRLKQSIPCSHLIGFDISKTAIQSASKKEKSIQWLVASVTDIPVVDYQVDVIVSTFSRCDWNEFSRVLKPNGLVLILGPGAGHLKELREAIYEQVHSYADDKVLEFLPSYFSVKETRALAGKMKIFSSETLMNLLSMTPHYWRIRADKKEALKRMSSMICSYDVRFTHLQFTP